VSILTLRKEVQRGNLRRLGPSASVAERSLLVPRPATFALVTISEATIAGVAVRQAM
jgi:CRP-like cAMP-binding protein